MAMLPLGKVAAKVSSWVGVRSGARSHWRTVLRWDSLRKSARAICWAAISGPGFLQRLILGDEGEHGGGFGEGEAVEGKEAGVCQILAVFALHHFGDEGGCFSGSEVDEGVEGVEIANGRVFLPVGLLDELLRFL